MILRGPQQKPPAHVRLSVVHTHVRAKLNVYQEQSVLLTDHVLGREAILTILALCIHQQLEVLHQKVALHITSKHGVHLLLLEVPLHVWRWRFAVNPTRETKVEFTTVNVTQEALKPLLEPAYVEVLACARVERRAAASSCSCDEVALSAPLPRSTRRTHICHAREHPPFASETTDPARAQAP